jgi:soluble lytic murein transglycosylase-like protein
MNSRLNMASSGTTAHHADQLSAWAMFARDLRSGFRTTMHHTLMAAGVIALGALSVMFVKPDLADHVKALSPFAIVTAQEAPIVVPPLTNLMVAPVQMASPAALAEAEPEPTPEPPKSLLRDEDLKSVGTSLEQKRVTKWLSRRYRVAGDATNMLVSAAYLTAHETKLDPLLILSVMAIESRFNPFAESPVGAQGLMQVMSKVHKEKFQKLGGVQAALNPVANIQVGAQILKEYVRRGGSIEAGLKMYVGAAAMETDFGYGAKVLAEYNRLKDVAAGKKVPIYTAVAKRAPAKNKMERVVNDKPETLIRADSATDETPV